MDMLKGKVAVVTGGTRGIGFAVVKKFLENGARVALLGSRKETVQKALAKLNEINPDFPVEGFWPSLTNPDQIGELMHKINEQYGSLDILVNVAGVSARDRMYDYAYEEFLATMNLNLNATFVCTQAAARIMKEQGGGVIVNTSSMVAIYGQQAGCAYPASKFAVNGLTKSLARELGPNNIRVNAVAPGITKTDMMANLPDEIIKPLVARVPLGRAGEPEEVANAFLFLASDMSSYVTGEILSVDGAAMN